MRSLPTAVRAALVCVLGACEPAPDRPPPGPSAPPSGALAASPASSGEPGPAPRTSSTSSAPSAPLSAATQSAGAAPTGAPSPPPSSAECADLSRGDGALPSYPRQAKPGLAWGADASNDAPWKTLRDGGIRFAIVQAAYGLGVNKSFPKNFAMAKACGLYRGAYHFLTPRESGRVQAERFLAHVGDDLGDLPPAVDVEKPVECKTECCDKSCADFRLVVEEWLDTVERTSGRRAMVYTVEPYFNQCLCGTSKLRGTRPLWLAGYPKFDFPERVTLAWGTWDFYQYLGNARVKGTLVDLNLASRTPEALGAWLAEVRAR